METPDRLEVAFAMQKFGGSFVKSLSQCVVTADPNNLQRIKTAFPELWQKYSDVVTQQLRDKKVQWENP